MRLNKTVESLYPLVGASLLAGWLLAFPSAWLTATISERIVNISLCILSIFFGFAFASISLLISLSERPFIKGTQESGAFALILRYHMRCIVWCALGIVFSIVMQLASIQNAQYALTSILIGISCGAILSTVRIVKLLWLLVKYMKFI